MIKHQTYILTLLAITFLISGCAERTIYKPYPQTKYITPCHTKEDLKKPEYEKFDDEHLAAPNNINILIDNLTKMKNHNDLLLSIVNCYDVKLNELNKKE